MFSIIIPALNEEHYLPLLLEDLKTQTFRDFEVIVVDGNSEDATREKATIYKKHFSLRVFRVQRRNLSYQRNYGAEKARSDYLVFLDADTRIDPDFLAKLASAISTHNNVLYLPTIYPQTTSRKYHLAFGFYNFLTMLSQKTPRPLPTAGAMIFEKKFFDSLGGYTVLDHHDKNSFFPEDGDIVLRAKKAGVAGTFLPNVIAKFSLRRMDKEGEWKAMRIYFGTMLRGNIHLMRHGHMKNVHLKYEMGGHVYKGVKKKTSR